MASDPQQFTNLAAKPEYASVVESFRAKLAAKLRACAIMTSDGIEIIP